MKPALVTNDKDGHASTILAGIANATRVVIHTAFLKSSGLTLLQPSLLKALQSGADVRVIAGLDFCLTEPKALWAIYEWMSSHPKGKLMLASQDKATFHPKLYYWESNGTAKALIGSANLTGGGFRDNLELSVVGEVDPSSTFFSELQDYLQRVESSARVRPATPISLSQYERRHAIFSKSRKEAEKQAKSEASELFELDEKKLSRYIEEYRDDKVEKKDGEKKRQNYKQAKKLLDSMVSGEVKTKKQFLETYEKLVGSKGRPSLWHSGGLFRSKKAVARKHGAFIELVKAVRERLKEAPDIVFDVGLEHARKIEGLGLNVLTEIMNTYAPDRFAVLNQNPVGSLMHLGFEGFGTLNKLAFSGLKYAKFNSLIQELARLCKFHDLSQVDHFLNYVYWKYAKLEKAPTIG
ncbi:restriction endonuclease PLD domain-containing protein [Desulforhabdus sp. TSK]|uniref:restriction endonuclease PLD domain-containing protein n=1 Tax=Desulforhabdus sp. TSK TaxID=2925014 RepID=UPI001FC81132|nr:restriction endonuclease PLD domain-containing protein [Desulforhabdus sp. TSK]GKT07175.1 hypothetical protein DSTSK_04800 [Desulforhabdus sp. TSK]